MEDLVIDWLEGNCPVQAEGTVDGYPFYFRARGTRWSFEVTRVPYADAKEEDTIFEYSETYHPEEVYAAGWMLPEEARTFIEKAAQKYKYRHGKV